MRLLNLSTLTDDELAFEIGWSIDDYERLALALEYDPTDGLDEQDLRERLVELSDELRIMRAELSRRALH